MTHWQSGQHNLLWSAPLTSHWRVLSYFWRPMRAPIFNYLERMPRTWKSLLSPWPLVAVLRCGYRAYIEDVGCGYFLSICSALPLPYSCFPLSRSWYFNEINPTNVSFFFMDHASFSLTINGSFPRPMPQRFPSSKAFLALNGSLNWIDTSFTILSHFHIRSKVQI